MIVSAPASSANIGSAFDAVGIALGLRFELTNRRPTSADIGPSATATKGTATDVVPAWHAAETGHPATIAFRGFGGEGPLWWRSAIPSGRGLGYSAAARVAGLGLALASRNEHELDPDLTGARFEIFERAAGLEDHADNAAAAVFGGIVVTAAGHVVPVQTPVTLTVTLWVPKDTSSTASSRSRLPQQVPFDDAVFNVARGTLLVAALATGALDALADATDDRLHQSSRFADDTDVAVALDTLRKNSAAAWLSGSGPSVAALNVDERSAADLADHLPPGRLLTLPIDRRGVRQIESQR